MTFLRTFFGHDINASQAVQLFTWHHALYFFVAVLAFFITLRYSYIIKQHRHEKRFKLGVAALLIIFELAYHIHNWSYPRFSIPLHICSFATIMNIVLLLTDSKRVFNYAFFFGVLGGFMALSIPFTLGYTYFNFRYYHFMIMHFTIMAVPLYYYRSYNFRVSYKMLLDVYRSTLVISIVVLLINRLLHTNYWFISEIPPEMTTFFINWPVYIFFFMGLVFTTMNILYFLTHKKYDFADPYEKVYKKTQ